MKAEIVPFHEIGVEQDTGRSVFSAIQDFIVKYPARSVPITEISQSSGVPGPIVKRVLFALLTLSYLKAAFRPRHRACDRVVGHPEESVRLIKEKALEGEYWCTHCAYPVEGLDDIDIEIIFKKPGTYAT